MDSLDFLVVEDFKLLAEGPHHVFTPNNISVIWINKSVLIPHLYEPELWIHHVEVSLSLSPVKTIRSEALKTPRRSSPTISHS